MVDESPEPLLHGALRFGTTPPPRTVTGSCGISCSRVFVAGS